MLRGAVLLAEGFDPLHDEVGLWQDAEIVRQLGLDALDVSRCIGDVGEATFVGVWIVEPLIILAVPEHGEEFVQRTLESDRRLDGFHVAADTCDFLQAQFVDLVSGHAGRRLSLEAEIVVICPIRLEVGADGLRRVWRICHVFCRKGDDFLVGAQEVALQRLFGLCEEGAALDFVNAAGVNEQFDVGLDVGEEGAVFTLGERCAGDDLLRLVDHALIGEFRCVYAALGGLFRDCDRFAKCSGALTDSLDVGGHVFRCVYGVKADQEGRQEILETVHLVKYEAIIAIGSAFGGLVVLVFPEVVGHFVCWRERIVVKRGFHFLGCRFLPGQLFILTGEGQAVDLVVQVFAAQKRQADRAELQLFFVFHVEPGVQPGAQFFSGFGWRFDGCDRFKVFGGHALAGTGGKDKGEGEGGD